MNVSAKLLQGLHDPASVEGMSLDLWDRVLRAARASGVLSRLAQRISDLGLEDRLAPKVRDHLLAARVVAGQHERVVRWEVNRVVRALAGLDVPVVLLKGGAYQMAELPAGRGRLVSDLDILVPRERLDEVERALLDAGWVYLEMHPYDQRYYRRWMHELPPMKHETRRTALDVHHTILPETSRLRPDPRLLLESVRELPGVPGLHVLSPEDMVLHAATHLFHDGDLGGGLRELIDLDDLLRHYGSSEGGFWERLVPRARRLGLGRPLFYALRYCARFLETPVPAPALVGARRFAPPPWVLSVMDGLVGTAIEPDPGVGALPFGASARWALYVRSHWLRMPAHLLAIHLTRKAWRAAFSRDQQGRERRAGA